MVLALWMLAAAWRGLPGAARARPAEGHWLAGMLSAYATLLRQKSLVLYVLILCMTTAAFYVFLSGAPIVLRSYGLGPDGIGWYIMAVPMAYMAGNFLTSRLIHGKGERWVMGLGQVATLSGLLLMIGLAFTMGALGGYSVGLAPHQGSRNLGMLMLGFTLCALGAHIALRRQRSHAFASK